MRPLRLALPVVALVAGCTPATGAPAAPAGAAPSVPPAAVTGFRAAVQDVDTPVRGADGRDVVRWQSTWRLTWEPVPGATAYEVQYGTSEGAGDDEPEAVQTEPSLDVEAAAGTSSRARLAQDRRAGLLFTSSQLLVQVRARNEHGAGPASLWLPVGDVPEGGAPIGTRELGAHGEGEGHGEGEAHGEGEGHGEER